MKKTRLLIELLFIFALPLLFIGLNLNIVKNYEYDSNGNYEVSNISLEFNEIPLINEIEFEYQYKYFNSDDIEREFIVNNYDDVIDFYIDMNSVYYDYAFNTSFTICWLNFLDANGSTNMFLTLGDGIDLDGYIIQDYNYFFDDSDNGIYHFVLGIGQFVSENLQMGEHIYIECNDYCSFSYKSIKYSKYKNPIYNLTINLENKLGINTNNIIIQILNIYTLLWVIMFIIWHLLYEFIDLFPHMFERKENE